MKIELVHTIINGNELYSVWLNKTVLHQSCKTKEEAMRYYEDIKVLAGKTQPVIENKVDLHETILTEEI